MKAFQNNDGLRMFAACLTMMVMTAPVVLASDLNQPQSAPHDIQEYVGKADLLPQPVAIPMLEYDERTGERFFHWPGNNDVRATLIEDEPGLVRLTHAVEEGVAFLRINGFSDDDAGTGTQIITLLNDERQPLMTWVVKHQLNYDEAGQLLDADVEVFDVSAGQKLSLRFDTTAGVMIPQGISESNMTAWGNPVVSGSRSPWGWVVALVSSNPVVVGVGVVAGGAVVVAAAGAYTGLVGPYDCSNWWAALWNGCV